MRELEKQGMTRGSNAYQYIKRKAYDEDKAFGTTEKGQIKFRTDIGSMDYNALTHLKKEVGNFLLAKTSTKSGIRLTYQRQKEAFEAKTGIVVSDELYSEFYRDAVVKNAIDQFGSDEVNRLMKKSSEMELSTSNIVALFELAGFYKTSTSEVSMAQIDEMFARYFYYKNTHETDVSFENYLLRTENAEEYEDAFRETHWLDWVQTMENP